MKKALKWVLIVLGVIVGIGVIGTPLAMIGMGKVRAETVHAVDMSTVADGEHEGRFCVSRWCYNVGVQVEGGRITGVRLLDNKMAAQKVVSDRLTKAVVERQNVDVAVDAYGGASISGKAFLKAVEDALSKGSR
jgi:uncharacterized protein with FMN-binding domain